MAAHVYQGRNESGECRSAARQRRPLRRLDRRLVPLIGATLGVEPRSGGLQIKNQCTIEIEGEERPACVAETISVIYGG